MDSTKLFVLFAVMLTAVGAWTDFRKGILPNWLTLGALLLAPSFHAAIGYSSLGIRGALDGFMFSLLGALVCGTFPMILYAVGGGRGGDVKLLAALGAICRPVMGIEAVFYGFLVAAIYSQVSLARQGKLMQTLGNSLALGVNPFLPKARRRTLFKENMTWIRLGPSIFLGTLIAVMLNWSAS